MRLRFILFLILILALLAAPVSAEVIFTSEAQEFHVDSGDASTLILTLQQDAGYDISGKLTINEVWISGESLYRESRVTDRTVFSDASTFPVNIPALSEGEELIVNLIFTYTDSSGTLRDVTLPSVTFRTDPVVTQSVTISSTESVHVVTPAVSVGSGTTSSSSSQTAGSVTSEYGDQIPDLSLNQTENHDEEFTSYLQTVPDFIFLEESITSYGYLEVDTYVRSSAYDTGTFSLHYRDTAGNEADLSGNISGTQSNISSTADAPAGIPIILQKDTRYLSAVSDMNAEGYLHSYTQSDASDGEIVILVHLTDSNGRAAEIISHLTSDNVTSVETLYETDLFSPWMVIVLVLVLSIAGILYWRRRHTYISIPPSSTVTNGLTRASLSDEYLMQAKTAFDEGLYPDSASYAGKALRYHLAGDLELTTDMLLAQNIPQSASDLLLRCRSAGFSDGETTRDDSEKLINDVEMYISYGYNN